MAVWWVNHKQTYKQETDGGYIWSPKTNKDGGKNISYDNLTYCREGDLIFSFANKLISNIGVIEEEAIPTKRPEEFGKSGEQWDINGWLVRVNWSLLDEPLKPKDFFNLIQPLLPEKYSPLIRDENSKTGQGSQNIYLGKISNELGELLLQLIKDNCDSTVRLKVDSLVEEKEIAHNLNQLKKIPSIIERQALTKSRLGQGLFRNEVSKIEPTCRVTGLDQKGLLIASHIKPWRESNNEERLDGANGLLLSPHIDKLFDKHLISFTSKGELICENKAARKALKAWGIDQVKIMKPLSEKQEAYMKQHRRLLKK